MQNMNIVKETTGSNISSGGKDKHPRYLHRQDTTGTNFYFHPKIRYPTLRPQLSSSTFIDRHANIAIVSATTFLLATIVAVIFFIHIVTYDPLPHDLPRIVVHVWGAPVHIRGEALQGIIDAGGSGWFGSATKRRNLLKVWNDGRFAVVGDRATANLVTSFLKSSVVPDAVYLDVDAPEGFNATAFQRVSPNKAKLHSSFNPVLMRMHRGSKMVDMNLLWSGKELYGRSRAPDTIILSVNAGDGIVYNRKMIPKIVNRLIKKGDAYVSFGCSTWSGYPGSASPPSPKIERSCRGWPSHFHGTAYRRKILGYPTELLHALAQSPSVCHNADDIFMAGYLWTRYAQSSSSISHVRRALDAEKRQRPQRWWQRGKKEEVDMGRNELANDDADLRPLRERPGLVSDLGGPSAMYRRGAIGWLSWLNAMSSALEPRNITFERMERDPCLQFFLFLK
ncbi:hypothetical protein BC829DRAFT_397607 [Chytridium lagenaria]|nr:hypothetical protein BC829DRAFT_397607 [Chytridium lagenaria]